MSERDYSDQHRNLVRMHEEQCEMDEPLIFEPVVFIRRERIKIGECSRIDSFVKIEGGEGIHIGRHVHIASFAHIGIGGGTVVIGDYAAVASGGKIISGSNEINSPSMSATAPRDLQSVSKKVTTLGPYAVVLTNAVVLPGVTLHEGAVLAAGAVATRDIPKWEVWGGVPARFLMSRAVKGKAR